MPSSCDITGTADRGGDGRGRARRRDARRARSSARHPRASARDARRRRRPRDAGAAAGPWRGGGGMRHGGMRGGTRRGRWTRVLRNVLLVRDEILVLGDLALNLALLGGSATARLAEHALQPAHRRVLDRILDPRDDGSVTRCTRLRDRSVLRDQRLRILLRACGATSASGGCFSHAPSYGNHRGKLPANGVKPVVGN